MGLPLAIACGNPIMGQISDHISISHVSSATIGALIVISKSNGTLKKNIIKLFIG